MRDTLLAAFAARFRRRHQDWRLTLFTLQLRRLLMSFALLDGFKTYIVAAAMVLAALAQLLGVDLPSFNGHGAGQLLLEGLAILFLRKGMKG